MTGSRLIFLLLLVGMIGGSWAQHRESYPAINEYFPLDHAPQALNLSAVMERIGYPPEARKLNRELRVYCRILVDAKGEYVRHEFSRVDHPALEAAVNLHLSQLYFTPGYQQRQPVASWVNIPLSFHPRAITNDVGKPWWKIAWFQPNYRPKRLQQLLDSLAQAYNEQRWQQVIAISSDLIDRHPRKKHRSGYQVLAQAHYYRAQALTQQGYLPQAKLEITEAYGILREVAIRGQADPHWQAQVLASRALLRLATGEISRGMLDLHSSQQLLGADFYSDIWLEMLQSEILTDAYAQQWQMLGNSIVPPAFTDLLSGLFLMDRHQFEAALPHLLLARQSLAHPAWTRHLDLRRAECLRHLADYESALHLTSIVLHEYPNDPLAHFVKGMILLNIGAEQQAWLSMETSLDQGLDRRRSKLVRDLFGWNYGQLGLVSSR